MLAILERQHARQVLIESAKRPLPVLDKPNKGAGPKTSPNDKAADPVGDVEQSILERDVRRAFKQYRGVKVITRHWQAPRLKVLIRQAKLRPSSMNASNTARQP
jgi:hypothetical protein